MTRRIPRTIGLVLIALFTIVPLAERPSMAAPTAESVTMSVQSGFDGLARLGTWMPVEVLIANRGPDITGELELEVAGAADQSTSSGDLGAHTTPAVLPRYSQKRFTLNILVPTIANRVTARLTANGNVLAQRDVPLETVPSGELLCGVLSRNSTMLDFLPSIPLYARQRNVRLARLEMADLPANGQVLSSLDCVVAGNLAGGALTERQMGALQSWVSAGGMLIVTGGSGWQKTFANMPSGLLPVKVTGTVPVADLGGLADFAQQKIEDPGPWLASQATVDDGTIVVAAGDLPILVAARRGAGAVFYLALDPAAEPLRSWTGSEFLWRYMLSNTSAAAASPNVASRQYSGWGRPPRQAMQDISLAKAPDGQHLALVVAIYAVLLVPGSYLIFRRRQRAGLSAAVAGLLAAAATTGSFVIADANRQADVVVNKISILRAWDDVSPAQSRTYIGMSGPVASRFDLVSPSGSLLQGLFAASPRERVEGQSAAELKIANGDLPTVRDFSLPPATFSGLSADSQVNELPLSGEVHLDGIHLTGKVTNRSDQAVDDASVVVGRVVVKLGPLGPGQSREMEFDLAEPPAGSYLDVSGIILDLMPPKGALPPAEEASMRTIVDSALNASYAYYARVDLSAVTLVAWLSDNPLPLEVRGAKADDLQHTLLVQTLPVTLVAGERTVIPADLIERRPMSVTTGNRLQGSSRTLAGGDSDATEYTLPIEGSRFAVDYLALNLEGEVKGPGGLSDAVELGSAFVFDWRTADWTEVGLTFGATELPDPRRFVSPLGIIRVSYTFRPPSDQSRLDISKFDITVSGRTQ